MKKLKLIIVFILFLGTASTFATGLLMPTADNYPKDFLKLRASKVTVNIKGSVAETVVYQEFVNEWYDSTDAVYSFPLPENARATKFLYWYKNNIYQAVLKVSEQAVNPGTGEGGVAALVNKYIGKNGIQIFLKGIQPGDIQKVELHYVNMCGYYGGNYSYQFPLDTKDFVKYPLELLQFDINIKSNSKIVNYDIPSHPGFTLVKKDSNEVSLSVQESKAYVNKDFTLTYGVEHSNLGVDFYSTASDSEDGHFVLFVRPENNPQSENILPKRIFFLLSKSIFGNEFTQSISAISSSLDKLSPKDLFNIVVYDYSFNSWKTQPVEVNPQNIQDAKDYLAALNSNYGSNLLDGIKECLNQITSDDSLDNSILIFTNGRSYFDPQNISDLNIHKAGIFTIGIGEDLDRSKLEMLAARNYGFVTYLKPDENLSSKMIEVFDKINHPILKNTSFEFGRAGVSQIIPENFSRGIWRLSILFNRQI